MGSTLNKQAETSTASNALNPFTFKLQFSRDEAAQMLGVSPRTLDRLIAEKELTVRRIGRRVLVPRDALTSFAKRDHSVVVVG
jgi:excisionase family DNA binding protein